MNIKVFEEISCLKELLVENVKLTPILTDTDTDVFKTSKENFQKIIFRTYFWGLTNIILMLF